MIIAIGGVSRAGKSTLAKLLKLEFEKLEQSVTIVEQDKYVHDEKDIPKIKNKTDWESPASINFKALKKAINAAKKEFDHVIVEGLLAFHNKKLNALYDKSIFIDIPKRLFLERKEVDLRWGSTPEPKWYMEHIWKSYRKYGMLGLPEDILKLSGKTKFDLNKIMNAVLDITPERIIFDEIADRLVGCNKLVERGPMMSAPGIRYKKKNFAFFHNNEMTFKLGKTFDAKANGIKKLRYLSPFKTKPPLKSWFIVGQNQSDLWAHLSDMALDYIQKEVG